MHRFISIRWDNVPFICAIEYSTQIETIITAIPTKMRNNVNKEILFIIYLIWVNKFSTKIVSEILFNKS